MPGEYDSIVLEYGLGAGLGVRFNSDYVVNVSFGYNALSDWSVGVMMGSSGRVEVGDLKITRNGSLVMVSIGGGSIVFSADIKNESDAVPVVVRKVGDRYSIFAYGKEIAYKVGSQYGFSGVLVVRGGTELYSFGTWYQDDYKDVLYMVSGIPMGSGILFSSRKILNIYVSSGGWRVSEVGYIRSDDNVCVVKKKIPIVVMR